jgi:glycosyltransferase involved in cell wall biosynthesis
VHPADDRPTSRRPADCIVHHYYYPQHGHVRRDAEALTRHGYHVSVIALQQPDQPRHERLDGVDVYRLPLAHRRGSLLGYVLEYGRLVGMTLATLTWLHLRKRFRVVEIDNMPDVLVFSALVPKLLGAKVILYIFDNMPELFRVTRGVSARHPLVRLLTFLERISTAFADRVIVTQETAREIARARGVADEKVAVVLNGPDEAIFTPRQPFHRPPTDDAFEIVTHGTMLERYGIHILIDALPKIVREVPTAHLTVFGEGEQRPALEQLARARGVADRVRFAGWVPRGDLLAALKGADVGYVGMLCNNMLSNKLMEYVAIGLPVVAARWPTYEHYFGDDDVAYFDAGSPDALADAVIGVARDPEAAARRAERAAARFKPYAWTQQEHAYHAVYEALLPPRRRKPSPRPAYGTTIVPAPPEPAATRSA